MSINDIIISKARVHNLKSINVKIPKNSLTVITGPSGSGKSSLAFDTIYIEGQRRYIESLSSYARQFLGQYQAPEVESITGLSPSIAIDQKTTSTNPRSTVGTITEIYDYMRVLYARVGTLYCPETGEEVRKFTPPQIVKDILTRPEKTKLQILAPINASNATEIKKEITKLASLGYSKIRIQNEILPLDINTKIPKNASKAELVVDRIVIKEGINKRLTDSVELALKMSSGVIYILLNDEEKEIKYSQHNIVSSTGKIYPDLEPRLFSFNSPLGACPKCNGLGVFKTFDLGLLIKDENLSIKEGAIGPLSNKNQFLLKMIESIAKAEKVDLDKPLKSLPKKFKEILINGTDKEYSYSFISENSKFEFKKSFSGIILWLEKKFHETGSEKIRKELELYMDITVCSECKGNRLNKVALATVIENNNIMDLCSLPINDAYSFFQQLKLDGNKKIIAEKLIKEIKSRLQFLNEVGLSYLSLNRPANTLSGGEAQRIRLATQLGSSLSGVLYVLDEPSIGLHQRDNQKLIKTLISLKNLGNTVIVVEHDEETMKSADYIIDMGPGAGLHGGEIVAEGTPSEFIKKSSSTSNYLSGRTKIEVPKKRRTPTGTLELTGASQNNIKNLNVSIPLGILVGITGVSGSGKSTLVHDILVPAVKSNIKKSNKIIYQRNNYKKISWDNEIKAVIELDQSPIGRTPHSNPATYSGIFDDIRTIFSKTSESQIRGYRPGRFSFNVKGGRCEECEGNGVKKIEMHFLPDVYVTCDECKGSRYNSETLSVLYKGKNISEILELGIEEGRDFFSNHSKVFRTLDTLYKVGLGYMKLGQSATTLSGGEAQRLKLAKELSKKTSGTTLYVLDEPTTGLHFQDIKLLLAAINELVEKGNHVLVIEHNLDVIKSVDHIIDLGPEGGVHGGTIVAEGTPEKTVKVKGSQTGIFLKKILD